VCNLIVETDVKCLAGMLRNPGMGPNTTINRWIDKILMFHFKLQHVQGKTFAADGLSRRDVRSFYHPLLPVVVYEVLWKVHAHIKESLAD